MNSPPRRISLSKKVKLDLEKWHDMAVELGLGTEFDRAVNIIEKSLLNKPLPPDKSPHTFGDPYYSMPDFDVLVSAATVYPLRVHFAISKRPVAINGKEYIIVYVMRFQPLFTVDS